MKLRLFVPLAALAVVALLSACGGDEPVPETTPEVDTNYGAWMYFADSLLPRSVATYGLELIDSTRIVRPAQLEEYAGAAASDYLTHNLVGLSSAKYEVKGTPVFAEVAQFANPEDAYGFYARLRPNGADVGSIGAEAFWQGNTLYFTSGLYAATLSVEGDTPEDKQARLLVAQEIVSRIEGTGHLPQWFLMFPYKDRVMPSNQYYPHDFLGIDGLDKIYTTTYFIDGDSALFFIGEDTSGDLFLILKEYAETLGKTSPAPDSIPYHAGYTVMFDHPEVGRIVAGLRYGKLVGVAGFVPESHLRLASLWAQGLQ